MQAQCMKNIFLLARLMLKNVFTRQQEDNIVWRTMNADLLIEGRIYAGGQLVHRTGELMKIVQYVLTMLVAGLVLFSATCAFAQDWPQWRGVNRNDTVTGFDVPQTWPKELTKKWQVQVGAGDATPALVGDKLYVFALQGSEEVTLCLKADDGSEVWRDKYTAIPVTGAAAQHPGPRSSPAVADGKVVTLGVGGILSCLDVTTGKLVWRKDEFNGMVPRFFTATSPIIADGMVLAHLGGQNNGAVMAYNLTTGDLKWKWSGEGPSYSSPVVATVAGIKQLVAMTDRSIVGLALADGKLLWQVPFVVTGMAYNAATPIVQGDTVIYTGQNRGTKAIKIAKQGDGFAATELWSNADVGVQFNSPVLKNGLIFGLSDKGNLYCLDATTGKTNWLDTTRRGNYGAILDVGSVLVVLPNTGQLLAYNPSDKAYDEVAQLKVAEKATFAHPILAGKRLFVKDQDTLTLWTME